MITALLVAIFVSMLSPAFAFLSNFVADADSSIAVDHQINSGISTKTNTVFKTIRVKVYATQKGRKEFLKKGILLDHMIQATTDKLEDALDTFLLDQANPVKIVFDPVFSSDLPESVDLDNCEGISIDSISRMLNEFNNQDSMTPTIVIMSCKADPDFHNVNDESKSEAFKSVGQKVPYVNHSISARCATRTAIFLETERPKFQSVFATALVRAAHVNILNPLIFEEVTNGDLGVRYEIRVSNDTIDSLRQDRCFYLANSQ